MKQPPKEVGALRRLDVERRGVEQPVIVPVVEEEKREKNKSHSIQPQSLLLRCLFSATSSRGFAADNLFLVLKAFWLGEDCKSCIFSSKENDVNFNVIAPVFLSPYFLNRCKGNNAILEVWNATDEGDQLVGITLLPLHTFYLAYHDSLVTKTLLDCKLPVISVDNWLQVVSTKSGSQVGEVLCLLTFGSDEQVTQLEIKRGLRNCDKDPAPVSQEPSPSTLACTEATTGVHCLSVSVLKLNGVFGAKVDAECYVECNIPDVNGSLKKLKTSCTACGVESKLSSTLEYQAILPVGKCLSKFFSSLSKDCLTFEIFCKISSPRLKNIRVAEAHMPLSDLEFLEDQFSISEQPAFLSLALPVKIEGEKMPRLITNDHGTLVVRLEYSKAAKEALISTDDNRSSVATQTDESEKEDSEQLWSTTLLSQLQKLRVSKTSAVSKENTPKKTFRCHVKVEKAIQLPYTKTTTDTAITHSEPCTYVSISNVGDAKVSPVVLYSIDPAWNWSCELELPAHLLLEGSENLVLKVWQLPSCTDTPNTKSNTILCFAAVQIADLKYGLPKISGWFNLVNYSGKYCGKIYMSITPLESLPELMFPQRGVAKQNPFVLPLAASASIRPVEPPAPCKPNPFIDLSSSVMESTLRKQLMDFDELTTQLKENISDLRVELAPTAPGSAKATSESEEKGSCGSEASEEESSTDTVDSDVAKLLAKFDLETLHKIVEQLDDEVNKMNHGSKPDYVCSTKVAEQQSMPPRDSDSLVPPIEADRASIGSHSDSGISNSARKRHLQQ
ncbi:Hypothetical predicted protein [Cloeon dipterum]|uniref:C2 domain-containing protein n=1 Tax=Cloeon dipterum TaxID=197152 RepID=A0A8S1C4U6_9INSE|nr:Hypothetical predicted protein [Cloeon dipterum]